jgi:GNAT acetyltransferase-like protein
MVDLQVLNEVDPAAWNEQVRNLNGCPFHSYEWSLFSASANSAVALYLRWLNEDGSVLAAGIAYEKNKNIIGLPFYKRLSLGSFPAFDSFLSAAQVLDPLVSYCRGHGFTSLDINSFGTPHGTEMLREFGFEVTKRWEFLMDMDGNEDGLWKKIHSKKRNLIRKGQKGGVQVSRVSGIEDMLKFRALALETYNRKTEQGISFPRPAEETYYRFLKERLLDTGLGRLYLAYDGNQPISGAFFAGFNGTAYYMLSSAGEEGLKKAAPDLVLWNAMTDYLKEGFSLFNLGGVSEHDLNGQILEKSGLYHFKIRFGADVYPCFKGGLVLRPKQFKLYSFLKALKSRFA